jgi:hypothetical protein
MNRFHDSVKDNLSAVVPNLLNSILQCSLHCWRSMSSGSESDKKLVSRVADPRLF